MRSFVILIACFALLSFTGCGGENTGAKGPLTDDQKKAVEAEDQRIADEESQGSVSKMKSKK